MLTITYDILTRGSFGASPPDCCEFGLLLLLSALSIPHWDLNTLSRSRMAVIDMFSLSVEFVVMELMIGAEAGGKK